MKIIRPKEAQARLGIGHSRFYDAIKKGELPRPVRFGRVTGIPEDELNAVIERLKAEALSGALDLRVLFTGKVTAPRIATAIPQVQ